MVTETAEKVEGQTQEMPKEGTEQTPQQVAQENAPEVLQADLATLTQRRDTIKAEIDRLTKEAGDLGARDKGLARLAREKQALAGEIADMKDKFEALRLSVHGPDQQEIPEDLVGNAAYEAEYQRRKAARQPAPGSSPTFTAEQIDAGGQLRAINRLHNIDFAALPSELTKASEKASELFYGGKPGEAVDTWEKAVLGYVAERVTERKAKSDTAKQERETLAASAASISPNTLGPAGKRASSDEIIERYGQGDPLITSAQYREAMAKKQ